MHISIWCSHRGCLNPKGGTVLQIIRGLVAKIFGLHTEQFVAPQPIIFGLTQAEQIVAKLNANGHRPNKTILSAIRVAGGVLGIQDNFGQEVNRACQEAEKEAFKMHDIAEKYRSAASTADERAKEATHRSQELVELAELFV